MICKKKIPVYTDRDFFCELLTITELQPEWFQPRS